MKNKKEKKKEKKIGKEGQINSGEGLEIIGERWNKKKANE